MSLGAGLFTALAVAASTAGWWLPLALLSAAGLAAVTGRGLVMPRDRAGKLLAAAAEWGLLVVLATVPSAYVASTGAVGASGTSLAAGFVVAAVVADAGGVRVSALARKALIGVLLVAALGFVAVCLAIPPAIDTGAEFASPSVPGLVLAVVVLVPLFRGLRGTGIVVGVVVSVAVALAALYQLGPTRLGLSVTSARDALAAADASALTTMLVVLAVLAGVTATLTAAMRTRTALTAVLRDTASGGRRRRTVPVLVPAGTAVTGAVVAAWLGPALVLPLAGVLAVVDGTYRVGAQLRRRR